jgi:hypothetical protein
MGSPAAAQEVDGLVSTTPGGDLSGVGLRAGASIGTRSAFEASVEWTDLGRTRRYADQIVWLYTVQGRRSIGAAGPHDLLAFITYGATGFAARTMRREGLVLLYIPPLLPTAGIGCHYGEGRLRFRADLTTVWLFGEALVVPRLSAAASLRIRKRRAPRRPRQDARGFAPASLSPWLT